MSKINEALTEQKEQEQDFNVSEQQYLESQKELSPLGKPRVEEYASIWSVEQNNDPRYSRE